MLAILCSGQGRQHSGMFELTAEAPQAAELFVRATRQLGADPRSWVRSAGKEALYRDRTAQILCATQALSAAAALTEVIHGPRCVAGYSVGEMAAWGVAGLIDGAQTLELVAKRAEAMDAASAGDEGMLYIHGLRHSVVDELCQEREARVAIVNPGDALLLAGKRSSLEAVASEALRRRATRVLSIPVAVAAHTYLLAKASASFRDTLRHVAVSSAPLAGTRLLSGIDGTAIFDVAIGLDKLAKQISQTVQWARCLGSCVEAGATIFFELGPGRALATMAQSAYPSIRACSLEDFRSLEGARVWLRRVMRET
jgi:[acyl-carrier-protein] S-malonyltransferase